MEITRFHLGLLLFGASVSSSAAITNLSPNSLRSCNIPSGFTDVVFTTADGNWCSNVNLPKQGNNGNTIKVAVNSTYAVTVTASNTDLPMSYQLTTGNSLTYKYSSQTKLWEVVAPTVTPPNNGTPLLLNTGSNTLTRVQMFEGAWAPEVVLPSSARNNAVVLLSSNANQRSKVSSQNLNFASTTNLTKGDKYAFQFSSTLGKWLAVQTPETLLTPANLVAGVAPAPTKPVTRLSLPANGSGLTVTLPTKANDRDRVIVEAQPNAPRSTLVATGQTTGTMTIGNGERYEFMWDDSKKQWQALQQPITSLKIADLPHGVVPTPTTPVTKVQAWDGNSTSYMRLPTTAKPTDRVVVSSSASTNFTVTGNGLPATIVGPAEEVVFVSNGSGWVRETNTIRILLAYSTEVEQKFGTTAAKTRQQESVRMTNEALANSGANFRFQTVGLMVIPSLGSMLSQALPASRTNGQIQTRRREVSADAVYYEGPAGDYCGLAYVNNTPSSYNMAATGSLGCGTSVMRHELGHNMGLSHGNGVAPTVMSGNALPYFATPDRYSDKLLPLSHGASVPNEVNVMGQKSPVVAKFHETLK